MKTILTFILLSLIGVTGFGQDIDSNRTVTRNTMYYRDSLWVRKIPIPHYDTIPVLMLVSDTTRYESLIYDGVAVETNVWGTPTFAFHMKGYKVIKTILHYHTYEGEFYLGENKKLLNPNIVVWMSVNMK